MSAKVSGRVAPMLCGVQRRDETFEDRIVSYRVPEIVMARESRVLTGRVRIVSSQEISPTQLSRHLELGEKILDYVQKRVLYSPNHPNRTRPKDSPIEEEHLLEVLDYVRDAETMKERVARSEKYNIGNCTEMASMGLQCKEISATRVERYELADPADHVFLVIGRDPSTNPEDPSTWNPETVICDPWVNACYPAYRMTDFLPNALGIGRDLPLEEGVPGFRTLPIIELFNPKKHCIKPDPIGEDSFFESGRYIVVCE